MFCSKRQFPNRLILVSAVVLSISGILVAQEEDSASQPAPSKKLYKIVDKNGKIYYSDQPQEGAKEIQSTPMQSIQMKLPKIEQQQSNYEHGEPRDPNAGYYDALGFLNLQNKGVIRNNGGVVMLTATVEPGLSKAHFLQFFIDGKAVGDRQKASQFQADNINYGTHSAYFQVVTATGLQIQKGPTIEFTLLHTPRQHARVGNTPTNNMVQIKLPEQPKVSSFKAMQKVISESQKNKF